MYYTSFRLSRIYPDVDDTCPKCRQSVQTFHMVLEYPHIQTFWQAVVADLNRVTGLSLDRDPLVFLLGITDNLATKHTKLFKFYVAYYARKMILSRWKLPDIPQLSTWRALINTVLTLYKPTYMGRNCPQKFDKIWATWVQARHLVIQTTWTK